MGIDVAGLVERMISDAAFSQIINNPLAQFGAPERKYLGAELLPELGVLENAYTEQGIRYRTVIANDGTRYSPVQIKGGILEGSFDVRLGDSDIGSHFTGKDYDAFIRLMERATGMQGVAGGGVDRPTMQAMASMAQWADMTLNRPLLEKNEKMRWEAIVNAQVLRTGDNNYSELVKIPNPTGQRVAAGGQWSSTSYDPYADIMAGAEFLSAKGYTVNRIFMPTTVRTKLSLNPNVTKRVGRFNIAPGVTTGVAGRATLQQIGELFNDDGLPMPELYDLQYRTQTGSGFFLPRNVFVMAATTGRDQAIDLGDTMPVVEGGGDGFMRVPNTLGYTAIGRPAGQSDSGRVVKVRAIDDSKPPRIEGEAWQTSFPVITEPEALFVITGIS